MYVHHCVELTVAVTNRFTNGLDQGGSCARASSRLARASFMLARASFVLALASFVLAYLLEPEYKPTCKVLYYIPMYLLLYSLCVGVL